MCMLLFLLFLFWLLLLCRRISGDGALDASVCVCVCLG